MNAGSIRLVEIQTQGTYIYDVDGNLVGTTDALGSITEYEYDDLGRVVKTHAPYTELDAAVIEDENNQTIYNGGTSDPDKEWKLDETNGYAGDQKHVTDNPSAYIAWKLEDLEAGKPYELWVTYDPAVATATNVKYVVYDRNYYEHDPLETLFVDQTAAPSGSVVHGQQWHYLGTYMPSDDALAVRLCGNASGTVVADAIMVVPARATTETVYDNAGHQEKTIDPLGNATLYGYDANGQLVTVTKPAKIAIEHTNNVFAQDGATGTGYIMYSEKNIHHRFATGLPYEANCDHFIVVKYNNGWYYDDNGNDVSFTPVATDRLIAAVNFDNNTVEDLKGVDAEENGITKGYLDGDLTFIPDYTSSSSDPGEFLLQGTYFSVSENAVTYTMTYDAAGQVRGQIDPLGHATSSDYDELGRTTKDLYYVSTTGTTQDSGDASYSDSRDPDDEQEIIQVGSGVNVTWTFSDLDAGKEYELLATWSPYEMRNAADEIIAISATDATFRVYTGTPGVDDPDSVTTVNQNYPPIGDCVLGVGWKSLGRFVLASNGSLTVQLTDEATAALTGDPARFVLAGSIRLLEVETKTVYEYDTSGNLISSQDALGNTTTYIYDEAERLIQTIGPDPDGIEGPLESPTTYNYFNDTTGQYTASISADLRVSTVEYDTAGRTVATYSGALADDSRSERFAVTGTWESVISEGGQFSNYQKTSTSGATATWTFDGLLIGDEYEVYVTWQVLDGNIANATYKVYQGVVSTETLVNAAQQNQVVDQTKNPGEAENSSVIENPFSKQVFQKIPLGTFEAANSKLIVQLSNSLATESGIIVADAVYLVRKDATSQMVYDQSGRVVQSIDADDNVTSMEYDMLGRVVTITYPDPDGVGNAIAPVEQVYFNKAGQAAATISPDLIVKTSEYDALGRTTATYVGAIVDNTSDSTRYDEDGTWTDNENGFLGNSHTTASSTTETATATATWIFSGLVTGEEYEVYATWVAAGTNANSVTYNLYHSGSTPSSSYVANQTLEPGEASNTQTAPISFSDRPFERIGAFTALKDSFEVKLTNATATTGNVVADAVYLLRKTPDGQTIYNLAGQAVATIDAAGNRTDYTYDALGQLVETALPDPDGEGPLTRPRTQYVYNTIGQLVETIEYPGETLQYDQRGEDYDRVVGDSIDIGAYEGEWSIGAATYTVNCTSDGIVNYLDDNFTLREALDLASQSGTHTKINFASGLSGVITLTDGNLSINSDVTIEGPGASTITISGNDSSRIFYVNTGITAEITGLSLMDGRSDGAYGGAIYCSSDSNVTLQGVNLSGNDAAYGGAVYARSDFFTALDCVFENNTATGSGGAISSITGFTLIENCTINNNSSATYGGGIFTQYNSIEIIDTLISNNAFNGSSGFGAGICIRDGENAKITRTSIENNDSEGNTQTGVDYNAYHGGGVYVLGTDSDVLLENCKITGNDVQYDGGGLYVSGSESIIAGTTFEANHAGRYGAGVYFYNSDTQIKNSLFHANTATSHGGGVYLSSGTDVSMNGVTVSGNSGNQGGGIHLSTSGSSVDLTNCTVTQNSASYGGGIRNYQGTVTLQNTIVAENQATTNYVDIYGSVDSDSSHNLVGNTTGSTGIIHDKNGNLVKTSDPSSIHIDLGSLDYHGGLTKTYVPASTSSAINAGSTLVTDRYYDGRGEGFLRIVGENIDIGATEAGSTVTVGASTATIYGSNVILVTIDTDESDGNYSDNDISLREALAIAAAHPGPDVIQFSPALISLGPGLPHVFTLALGELSVNSDVTITGPGADKIAINASDTSRIFNIVSGTTVSISGLTLTDGYTTGSGGAVYAGSNVDLTIDSIRIVDSRAYDGGGLAIAGGTLNVLNSEFSGNTANGFGGGLYIGSGSKASLVQTTISGNQSNSSGAGIYCYNTEMAVSNSTITNNTKNGTTGISAGGMFVASSILRLDNTIVAKNTATYKDVYLYGSVIISSSSNNLIGSSSGLSGGLVNGGVNGNKLNVDPKLAPLAFNGGSTRTHALYHGSPAIDAGNVKLAVVPPGAMTQYVYDDHGHLVKTVMPGDGERFKSTTINKNVLVDADAEGTGYIMLSKESIFIRFPGASFPGASSPYFVTVRYNGTTWQCYDGISYYDFTPRSSDRLIAQINFSDENQTTSLEGTNDIVHGILTGNIDSTFSFSGDSSYVQINGEHILNNPPTYFTTYDELGRVISQTDPLAQTTTREYDNLGRLKSETNANGETTRYTYDTSGRMISLIDPENNTTTWTYGISGQVATETITVNSNALTRHYEYDAFGNLVRTIDRNYRVVKYGYDNLGRQTTEDWYDNEADTESNKTYTTTYDIAGRVTSSGDGNTYSAYWYNSFGNLDQKHETIYGLAPGGFFESSTVLFGYSYDVLGQKIFAVVGSNACTTADTYTYDNLGRVTRIIQSNGGGSSTVDEKRVDFLYNDRGLLESMDRYADLDGLEFVARTVMKYDERNQLTDLTHKKIDAVLADYNIDWDVAGQITDFDFTSLVGDDGSADYDYDATGQLTDADYSYQTNEDYSYDENGNRDETMGYTTGDHNRITNDGTYGYHYDNEGNIIRKYEDLDHDGAMDPNEPCVEYQWDHRNRLTKVTFRDTTGTATKIIEYAYDSGNRWVRKTLDNGANGVDSSRIFVHDNGQIVLDFEDGSLAHRYLWGQTTDQLLADETVLTTGNETRWALTDHLGSVRDLVDSSGNVDMHAIYDAYGNATIDPTYNTPTLFLYTARPFDVDTALQNNLNRWYDASIGRWMSVDPIGLAAGDLNLYRYVHNTPLIIVDPRGLDGILPGGSGPIWTPAPIGPPSGRPIGLPGLPEIGIGIPGITDPVTIWDPESTDISITGGVVGNHKFEASGDLCGDLLNGIKGKVNIDISGEMTYNWGGGLAGDYVLANSIVLKYGIYAKVDTYLKYAIHGKMVELLSREGFLHAGSLQYNYGGFGNAYGGGGVSIGYQSTVISVEAGLSVQGKSAIGIIGGSGIGCTWSDEVVHEVTGEVTATIRLTDPRNGSSFFIYGSGYLSQGTLHESNCGGTFGAGFVW